MNDARLPALSAAFTAAKKRRRRRENLQGIAMAVWPFAGYVLFGLFPMLLSLYVSFHELHSYNLTMMTWAGLDNYIKVLRSQLFYTSLFNTLYYCLNVPVNMAVALFIANLLTKPLKGGKFMRTVLFLPSVCSTVAVTLMWSWIFEPNYGVVNTLLSRMGLSKIGFMTTKEWFMPSVLTISVWLVGTNIVLMQAALAGVDTTLKEAARIDGAGGVKTFWHVTVPGITPTLFYMLVMNLVASLQEMAMMQILSGSGVGPGYRALTLSYYLYRMAFVNTASEGMGLASALSWIIALAVIVLTRLNFALSKKWVTYD